MVAGNVGCKSSDVPWDASGHYQKDRPLATAWGDWRDRVQLIHGPVTSLKYRPRLKIGPAPRSSNCFDIADEPQAGANRFDKLVVGGAAAAGLDERAQLLHCAGRFLLPGDAWTASPERWA
jgi:hypothetical protein